MTEKTLKTRSLREEKPEIRDIIEPWQEKWLLYKEETDRKTPGFNVFEFIHWQGEGARKTWEQAGEYLLDVWISENPCSRPYGWWKYEAPREPVPGFEYHAYDRPQRERIGGVGTPEHDLPYGTLNFHKGVPVYFCTEEDQEEFPELKAYNVDDPPLYESEASYLQRHNFLTPFEKKWLSKHPEALKPVIARQHESE